MTSESDIRDLVTRLVDRAVSESGVHVTHTEVSSIALGADHGGFHLKQRLADYLRDRGYEVVDCGTDGTSSVDYPDFAHAVARLVADRACESGVIVDGAGIGSCMAANKVPGIRASLCYDVSSARNSREHNHANVLTLGAGLIGESLACQIVEAWLATPWGGGRHARRVAKIVEIEHAYAGAQERTKKLWEPAKT